MASSSAPARGERGVVFSSIIFIFAFLPLTVACHFFLPHRLRDAVLLLASLAFYLAGEPAFGWVMLASLALNYSAGLLIAATAVERRFAVLAAAVIANMAALFVFKYADFALAPFVQGTDLDAALRRIALPLGISFFTFHGISYIVDVYRGRCPAQEDIVRFGLYFVFFPQLIAGPIVRYHSVAAQLERRRPGLDDLYEGFRRFALGLAKKVLIANPLGSVADAMFAIPPTDHDFASAWLGAVAYALQIYFDFSGYSDMAIGLARVFGIRFPENFNYPYIAATITEFWRRWHISLSLWFRDYVYVPLGGNRRGAARTYLNLATVFLLCGLWHGASWTFVVWGLYFGVFLIIERILGDRTTLVPRVLRHAYALVVILVGWVIFRSPDLGYAGQYLLAMISPELRGGHIHALYNIELGTICILAVGVLCSTPLPRRLAAAAASTWQSPSILRECIVAGAAVSTFVIAVSFVVSSSYNPFIYFRF
jgi:alginate O-acetyltransferase complex protein AlgI